MGLAGVIEATRAALTVNLTASETLVCGVVAPSVTLAQYRVVAVGAKKVKVTDFTVMPVTGLAPERTEVLVDPEVQVVPVLPSRVTE
jgi:hypothetical protein